MDQELLVAGAQVDAQNRDGWTALMIATAWGHTPVVQRLLEAGAEPGLKTLDGETALDLAEQRDEELLAVEKSAD